MAITLSKLVIKNSALEDSTPPSSFLDFGELALNYNDGLLYFKNNVGEVKILGSINFSAKNVENVFTELNTFKSVNFSHLVLSTSGGVLSWDAKLGNIASVILGENTTLNTISNISPGSYVLRITQDATGNRTFTLGSNFKTVDGDPVEISLTANAVSILTFVNFGDSNVYVTSLANLQ